MNSPRTLLEICETLYGSYNKVEYLYPDPLWFVMRRESYNQEAWGFFAAMVSLGTVGAILGFLNTVHEIIGDDFLGLTDRGQRNKLVTLKYRFYKGTDILGLLDGIHSIKKDHGSLLVSTQGSPNPITRIIKLREALLKINPNIHPHLLPDPLGKGANKRYAMFLRWACRKDDIDPGFWHTCDQSLLEMPVDTHILQNARILGLTQRKVADAQTRLEITQAFKAINPSDPLKYDFVLSRIGIHPQLKQLSLRDLLSQPMAENRK